MEPITSGRIAAFMKRFDDLKGRLHSIRLKNVGDRASAVITLSVREGDRKVRLRLAFDDIEEYRLQRRPGGGLRRIRRAALGVFEGIVYINLEVWEAEERPARIDFRMSDTFLAGRTLAFEIVTGDAPPPVEPSS